MQIMTNDGRVVGGTPVQMVRTLMATGAMRQTRISLAEYVRAVIDRAQMFQGRPLAVTGRTDEELAQSFIKTAVRAGLLTQLPEA